MTRVVGIPPGSICRSPTTRDNIRTVLRGPIEGIRLRYGPELRYHPDWHELGTRCHTGCPESSIRGSPPCKSRTMLLVQRVWSGISVVRGCISWGNDLAPTGKTLRDR